MDNPFVLPERGAGGGCPLNPLSVLAHDPLYVDVDGTGKSFNQFKEFVKAFDFRSTGFAALANGPDGCGKSSLLHRCAHYLDVALENEQGLKPVIIDLSEEDQPALPVSEKVLTAWTIIMDQIDLMDGLISPADNNKLVQRMNNPQNGIAFLSKVLLATGKCLVLILPPIELDKEFKEYLSLRRSGVLLLCESSQLDVRKYCERHHGPTTKSPVKVLTLDVLNVEDGWKFVNARYQVADEKYPRIDEASILEFMETRIQNAGRTTIRELHVACMGVAGHAIKQKAEKIELNDFALYYLRAGGI